MIADLDMKVAKLFGMIHKASSETSAVRTVFYIDPEGILRAMIYYPLTSGRNMDEILRLLDSLQTVDEKGVATPANWRPGDPNILPPPRTQEEAEKRLTEGYECVDWYLCKKKPKTRTGNLQIQFTHHFLQSECFQDKVKDTR